MDSWKIVLKCKDGSEFEVRKEVAFQMQNIKHMICTKDDDEIISVPDIEGPVLTKLLEYCERHANADDKNLKSFDDEFVKLPPQGMIFDLILAANKLGVGDLYELLCKAVADMLKDMNPEEIRKMFNIKSDITPEEEAQIRKDNPWAFN